MSSQNVSSKNNNRLDYLDVVRAFALILGIIFHASLSFMPIFIGWAVMDISTSSMVPTFVMISHSFRLALFFLIAGFFSHMKFHDKGVQPFMTSRLVRIAIPFFIGWIVLRPMIVSAWIMGEESMRGEANILNAFKTGVATLGDFPKDLFIGTHLWFLYYLLIISFSVVLMQYLIGLYKPIKLKLTQIADTTTCWLCNSQLGIFTVAIPTTGCLWFMSHWGIDTPDKTLTPQIPVLLLYGGFFLFGWLLHRQAPLMEQFARLTWNKLVLCLLAVIATYLLSSYEMNYGYPQYKLLKASFALCYAIMMCSLVSLTLGLFKRLFDRPSKTVRYIADSSYWLYLIHLPIVIWLQVAFAELCFHWSIKLVIISALTVFISIVLYDVFVRSTFIGTVLNGKRKPGYLFNSDKGK
jgi:glucan biosynthesis protein C